MSTKEEKIKGIVDGTANEMFFKDIERGEVTGADYDSYWQGISLADVMEYAEKNGISKKLYFTEPGPADGLYLIHDNEGWTLYYQEQEQKREPAKFKTEKEALDQIVVFTASTFGIFKDEEKV